MTRLSKLPTLALRSAVTRTRIPCRHQSDYAASILHPTTIHTTQTNTTSRTLKLTPSVYRDGRFHNPWPTARDKTLWDRFFDINAWLKEKQYFLKTNPHPLKPTSYPNSHTFPAPFNQLQELDLDEHLPIKQPDLAFLTKCGSIPSHKITHTWLGHATCLVQLGDVTILTDPWFSQRASAWQAVGPSRIRPPACEIDQLPHIDVIVISHNHFDHLDSNSVIALAKKAAQQEMETGRIMRWFVPLGLAAFLRRSGVPHNRISELDWWQTVKYDSSVSEYSVTAVPAQHWTSRQAWLDSRKTLWCGVVIESNNMKYYFTGDTGYCPVFKEIGDRFGSIDISSIPVGAFRPRALLSDVHCDPQEAVKIHQDVRSKRSVAVHWGTIMLGDEFIMEPKFELDRATRRACMKNDEFVTSQHGETIVIDSKSC